MKLLKDVLMKKNNDNIKILDYSAQSESSNFYSNQSTYKRSSNEPKNRKNVNGIISAQEL